MIIQINPKQIIYTRKIQSCCGKRYDNHPRGCPNLGIKEGCPPQPLLDRVIDFNKPVYVISTEYDVGTRAKRIRKKYPNWTIGQVYNIRQWQPAARSLHKREYLMAMIMHDIHIIKSPEAHGVDLDDLMSQIGVELEWPPRKIARVISMGGTLTPDYKESLTYQQTIR